jgi:hypothetical protein
MLFIDDLLIKQKTTHVLGKSLPFSLKYQKMHYMQYNKQHPSHLPTTDEAIEM